MIELYKSSKHKEKKHESSNLNFSPSAFLRRSFSIIADRSFCNDIHWPVENEDDYIRDSKKAFFDKQLNNLVALRTYAGKGKLILSGEEFFLEANSLIIFKHHQPRMHQTIGEFWEFDWFEFHINELNIPNNTIFNWIVSPQEKNCRKNLLSIQNKYPNDIMIQGCFSFLLTIWLSNLKKEPLFYSTELEKCIAYIDTHLNEALGIETLSSMIPLSPRYFRKIFKNKFGIPPKEYIENKRWEKTISLLTTTNLILEEIAEAVGMTSAYYLSVRFKQQFGVSPSKYRAQHKKS